MDFKNDPDAPLPLMNAIMANHLRSAWVHGAVGLGIGLVVTAAVLLLLPNTLNAYLVLAVWLVCISLLTFAYYGYDKFQAVHAGRRVPEIVLHLFAMVGGSLGAYMGMWAFRHKTIKGGFRIVFWLIVFVQLAACAVAAYGLWQREAN
jgi:uncharacterized membrane protein YsdA (DUF1294 family)